MFRKVQRLFLNCNLWSRWMQPFKNTTHLNKLKTDQIKQTVAKGVTRKYKQRNTFLFNVILFSFLRPYKCGLYIKLKKTSLFHICFSVLSSTSFKSNYYMNLNVTSMSI